MEISKSGTVLSQKGTEVGGRNEHVFYTQCKPLALHTWGGGEGFTTAPGGDYCYSPHFKDEETNTKGNEVTPLVKAEPRFNTAVLASLVFLSPTPQRLAEMKHDSLGSVSLSRRGPAGAANACKALGVGDRDGNLGPQKVA